MKNWLLIGVLAFACIVGSGGIYYFFTEVYTFGSSSTPQQVEAQNALREQVASFNNDCPMDMGIMGELSKLTYNESDAEVVMTISISKALPLKIEALNECKNTLKRSMLGNWVKSTDVVNMMKLIAEAGSRFAIVFRSGHSQGKVKIDVSEKELNDLIEGKVDPVSPREMLSIMVMTTNAMCPQQIDEYTTLSSASIEGENFVYNYSVDEFAMDSIFANQSWLKDNIRQQLSSNDPTISQVVAICKQAGVGIRYKYAGDTSGRVCTIEFRPSEL